MTDHFLQFRNVEVVGEKRLRKRRKRKLRCGERARNEGRWEVEDEGKQREVKCRELGRELCASSAHQPGFILAE